MTVTGMTAEPRGGADDSPSQRLEASASSDLASAFLSLQKKARSGTLRLMGPSGQTKYVYVNKGIVELVKTSKARTLLGRALLKRRMLTEPQLNAALERQKAGRHQLRLGQILVGMGIVPEAELMNALRFQIAEEVLELFTWTSFRSDFIRGDPPLDVFEPEDLQAKVALKPEKLVVEAQRRATELDAIRRTIQSFGDVYAPTADAAARYEQRADAGAEREVIACCDGRRDVDELLEEVHAPDLVALRVLAKMAQAGEVAAVAPAQLVVLGQEREDQHDFERARKRYLRAEELGHLDFDLPRRIGQIDEVLGDMAAAASRYLVYAQRCAQQGYPDVATATLERIIVLAPQNREAREYFAKLLETQGKSEEAAKEYEKLLQDLPQGAPPEERARAVSAVLSVAPERIDLREQLAALYVQAGDPAQAIMEYQDVAASALAEEQLGKAIEILGKILEIDPAEILTHQQLASTLAKAGRKSDAVGEYLKIADQLTESGLATASAQTLVQIYEKVVELDPQNASARKWLAQAYEGKEQADKAIAHYTGMLDSLRKSGKKDELEKALDKLVSYSKDDRALALERARLKKELGKTDEARAAFRSLAEAAAKNKEPELAKQALAEVVAEDPGDLDSQLALAKVEGHASEAGKAAHRCAAVFELALLSGKLDVAEEAVKRALDLAPDDAHHRERLARILEARTRKDEAARTLVRAARLARGEEDLGLARAWAKRALDLDGTCDDARELIEALKRGIQVPAAGVAAPAGGATIQPAAPIVPAFAPSGRGTQKIMPTITGGASTAQVQGYQSKRVGGIANKLKELAGRGPGEGQDDLYQAPAEAGGEEHLAKKARSAMEKLRALKGGGEAPAPSPAPSPEPAEAGEAAPAALFGGDEVSRLEATGSFSMPSGILAPPAGTPGSPSEKADASLAKRASSAMDRLKAFKSGAPPPPRPKAEPAEGSADELEIGTSPKKDAGKEAASALPAGTPGASNPVVEPAVAKKALSAMDKLKAFKSGAAPAAAPSSEAASQKAAESAALPAGTPGSSNPVVEATVAKKALSAMDRLKALKGGGPPKDAAAAPSESKKAESAALPAGTPGSSNSLADASVAKKASSAMDRLKALKGGAASAKVPSPEASSPKPTPSSQEWMALPTSTPETAPAPPPPPPPPPPPAAAPAAASAESAPAAPAGEKKLSAAERLKALKSGGAPPAGAAAQKISKGPEAPGEAADPALSKKAASAKERLKALRGGSVPAKAQAPSGAEAAGSSAKEPAPAAGASSGDGARTTASGQGSSTDRAAAPADGAASKAGSSTGAEPGGRDEAAPGEGLREPSGSEATA